MTDNLRDTILTSPSGQRMIGYVSPIYDNSYIGLWLFQAIGREFDDLSAMMDTLPDQLTPDHVTWAIELWERRYGLSIPSADTIEKRRANILLKRLNSPPMNPARMEAIAHAVTNCNAHVEEHTGPFTFTLYVEDMQTSLHGALKKAVNRAKPSHISYLLSYYSIADPAPMGTATLAGCVARSERAGMALLQLRNAGQTLPATGNRLTGVYALTGRATTALAGILHGDSQTATAHLAARAYGANASMTTATAKV